MLKLSVTSYDVWLKGNSMRLTLVSNVPAIMEIQSHSIRNTSEVLKRSHDLLQTLGCATIYLKHLEHDILTLPQVSEL